MVARQQHQQAGPWVAGEEEEDEAHQGLQGGKRTHVPMGEGGTGAAESTCWDPAYSMMKITGISVIAEPGVLVEEEKMAGLWPMAQ